jgi:two-component system phosphate regulon sensor histidine kinase PhoR
MNISFRWKIILSLILILCISFLFPFIIFKDNIADKITYNLQNRSEKILEQIVKLYNTDKNIDSNEELKAWLTNLSKILGVRLGYVSEKGKVIKPLYDTLNSGFKPQKYLAEVINHFSNQKKTSFYRELQVQKGEVNVWIADKVEKKGSIAEGFLFLRNSDDLYAELIGDISQQYIYIVIVTLMVVLVLGYVIYKQHKQVLGNIIGAAESIGKGEYSERVSTYDVQEFLPLSRAINRMADRIENHIHSITEHKGQLEAILNGIKEGVMVLDSKGKIKTSNESLNAIFSLKGQADGRYPIEIVRSHELQQACTEFTEGNDAFSLGSKSLEIRVDEDKYYDVNIVPLDLKQSDLKTIIVFHEISELKRLERIRQDFVANVSHELRTPLTSIKGYAETVKEAEYLDQEMVRSFMDIVVKNANSMTRLLEDLLQLSKLESHKGELRDEEVNIYNVLLSAWKFCSSIAQERNIGLDNQLSETQVIVLSDYDQLVQVMRNLLENAIKFSPEGETISVYAQDSADRWEISVQDNGPGISKKDQGRIFERFYRAGLYRNGDKVSGTGLGLAICRHIIRNQEGQIWVESPVPGELQGSVFRFTLKKAETNVI